MVFPGRHKPTYLFRRTLVVCNTPTFTYQGTAFIVRDPNSQICMYKHKTGFTQQRQDEIAKNLSQGWYVPLSGQKFPWSHVIRNC